MIGGLVDLVVSGPRASGKTRLAAMLSDVAASSGMAVIVENAKVLGTWRTRRRALLDAQLLIIDDLDPADPQFPDLLEIIDQRAERGLTILLSSVNPSDWHQHVRHRQFAKIIDRFLEHAQCMELLGKNEQPS